MGFRLAKWLVLAGSLVVPWTARAESAPVDPETLQQAADEFEAGRRAFRARDFETAALHFENANRLVPNAETLRIAIRARREAKQLDRAATLAAMALDRYPEDTKLRDYARRLLTSVEKQLHKVEVHCTPECSLALNNRVTPYTRVDKATLYVEPGEHSLVAGWSSNRTELRDIAATPGTMTTLDLVAPEDPEPAVVEPSEVEPEPTPASPTVVVEPARGGLPPAVFWAGAGLTVALGGVSIWSGIDTQSNPGPDRVRAECVGQGTSCPLYQDGLSRQRRTNALLIATGVTGVATAVIGLFATDWGSEPTKEAESSRGIAPTFAFGDGVTVGAAGRF